MWVRMLMNWNASFALTVTYVCSHLKGITVCTKSLLRDPYRKIRSFTFLKLKIKDIFYSVLAHKPTHSKMVSLQLTPLHTHTHKYKQQGRSREEAKGKEWVKIAKDCDRATVSALLWKESAALWVVVAQILCTNRSEFKACVFPSYLKILMIFQAKIIP